MKVTVEKTDWNFPCLGIAKNGEIVLFSEQGKGTCIDSPSQASILGRYSIGWNMALFTPFKGKITIEQ